MTRSSDITDSGHLIDELGKIKWDQSQEGFKDALNLLHGAIKLSSNPADKNPNVATKFKVKFSGKEIEIEIKGDKSTPEESKSLYKHYVMAAIKFSHIIATIFSAHKDWIEKDEENLLKESLQYLKVASDGDYISEAGDKMRDPKKEAEILSQNVNVINEKLCDLYIEDNNWDDLKAHLTDNPENTKYALNHVANKIKETKDYPMVKKVAEDAFAFIKDIVTDQNQMEAAQTANGAKVLQSDVTYIVDAALVAYLVDSNSGSDLSKFSEVGAFYDKVKLDDKAFGDYALSVVAIYRDKFTGGDHSDQTVQYFCNGFIALQHLDKTCAAAKNELHKLHIGEGVNQAYGKGSEAGCELVGSDAFYDASQFDIGLMLS